MIIFPLPSGAQIINTIYQAMTVSPAICKPYFFLLFCSFFFFFHITSTLLICCSCFHPDSTQTEEGSMAGYTISFSNT